MNDVLTSFKSFVTSVDVNRARTMFLPPGRYFGFDTMESNGSPGTHIPALISHQEVFSYLDFNNVKQEGGAIVTNHGTIYLCDIDRSILIPTNPDPTKYRHSVLIAEYEWVNQEVSVIPNLLVLPGKLCDTPDEEFNLNQYTNSQSQIPLGKIVIDPLGVSINACTYHPLPTPTFAGKSQDLSMYARRDQSNDFQGKNTYKITSTDSASFTDLGGGFHAMVMPGSNGVEIEAPAGSYKISSFIEQGYLESVSLYLIHLKEITLFTITKQPSIDVPEDIQFNQGDSFILARFGNTWKVFSSFDRCFRDLINFNLVKNYLVLKNQRNSLDKGLYFNPATVTVSGNTLRLPDAIFHQIVLEGSAGYTIDSIRRYVSGQESFFPTGTFLLITVRKGLQSAGDISLRLNDLNKDTFFINRHLYNNSIEEVKLQEGTYLLLKTGSASQNQWNIISSPGSIGGIYINEALASSAYITVDYFSWLIRSEGLIHLKASITCTDNINGLLGSYTLSTDIFAGKTFQLFPSSDTQELILAQVSGTTLNLYGTITPKTFYLDILIPL